MAIKILLVDDQPAVRQGLRMRLGLEQDLVIVGEAADGAAAITLARALCPDVVVMDAEMPGMDGIAATTALKVLAPQSAVVILSLYDDSATQARAKAAGAVAFIDKYAAVETLVKAIRGAVGAIGVGDGAADENLRAA